MPLFVNDVLDANLLNDVLNVITYSPPKYVILYCYEGTMKDLLGLHWPAV